MNFVLRWLPLIGLVSTAFAQETPPPTPREFRGVWVATVANIDWPSKPGLPVVDQKEELIRILDRARQLNFNAVVFQVRPAADALYASELEPWSAFLTGAQGEAPEPFYDPLAFAVEEAHQRGLELHAWFNPYRALHPSARGELAENHLRKTQPDLVKQYGRYLWMDPGEPAVQDRSLAVILDVVKRYDVDGVHLDDYFYPYKERGPDGNILDFPDEPSFTRYQESGGTLAKDDWRRSNVDTFIRRLYESVKAEKPHVKVGLAPFGIWRPGNPPQIQGFDPYAELYADSRKWLQEGWCDYFTPQLYWPVGQTAQDYEVLLDWWLEQNAESRHVWPGLFTSRIGDSTRNWKADVVAKQISVTRERPAATGHIHFSMKAILQERPGLVPTLQELYSEPALVPASPWLDKTAPAQPSVHEDSRSKPGRISWMPNGSGDVFLWVVRQGVRDDGDGSWSWETRFFPASQRDCETCIDSSGQDSSIRVAVSAVDRFGNESEATIVELGPEDSSANR